MPAAKAAKSAVSAPAPKTTTASVSRPVGNPNTTAPAQKPWLLVGSLVLTPLALLAIDSTRHSILGFTFSHPLATIFTLLLVLAVTFYVFTLLRTDEWRGGGAVGLYNHADYDKPEGVNAHIDEYTAQFSATSRQGDGSHERMIAQRQKNYMQMVNHFYDVVTDFYEYGWGDCFHFGFRFAGEGFQESLRRTEYYLALRLGLNHATHAVDIGCGVGGPMRNIARFTGSKITGINNNAYQIKVGTKHNARWGCWSSATSCSRTSCTSPWPTTPTTTRTPSRPRAMRPTRWPATPRRCASSNPGGYFAAYDWCVTDRFDRANPRHVSTREGIEVGNGLPVLATTQECVQALEKAGFEVVDYFNAQQDAHRSKMDVPWYQSLAGEYTLTGFRMTPLGRRITHLLVSTLEFMRIAPKGSVKVSKLLNDTAIDLVNGGKMEIFTPSFFFLARKPL